MGCPEDDLLLRFIARESTQDERVAVMRHLLECGECREVSAMLARLLRHSERAKTAREA